MKRRTFMATTLLTSLAFAVSDKKYIPQSDQPFNDGKAQPVDKFWNDQEVNRIIKNIRIPVFPNKQFNIQQFGAKPDGISDCFQAFDDAIKACHNAGGGRIIVPEGRYLVNGPITLLSNVELHLESKKTVVLFGTDPKFYPNVLTQFEANPCYNYSPFLYAYQAKNIAVTGKGIFDGQASTSVWWPWKAGDTKLKGNLGIGNGYDPNSSNILISGNQAAESDALKNSADMETYVPWAERVFGYKPSFGPNAGTGKMSFLRPNFVGFWECDVVLIEGVTFERSPMWLIAPVLCKEVTVRGITAESLGPNSDGCNPVCCSFVLIEQCNFNTGDDCIAIKSGRGGDGFNFSADGKGGPRPSYDIVIQNCNMAKGHGGVTLGSEISGGVYNVYAQNIKMTSTELYAALRLKTNSGIGGYIRNIYMRHIEVPSGTSPEDKIYGAILLDANYNGYGSPQHKSGSARDYLIQDISVSDFTCGDSNAPVFINIYPSDLEGKGVAGRSCVIKDIHVRNAHFGKTIRDPKGITPVVYNLGKASGVRGNPVFTSPKLAGLQTPVLINVTVNGTKQSNISE